VNDVLRLGDEANGLTLALQWDACVSGSAAEVTGGCLRVELNGYPVWQGEQAGTGMWWTWVELLEFLAHQWPWLTREQVLPLGLSGSANRLQEHAQQRWLSMPKRDRDLEELRVYSFGLAHNLAQALNGCWPESLWIVRRGNLCEVATDQQVQLLRADAVFGVLQALGDAIAHRVALSGDARAQVAVSTWMYRDAVSAMDLVRAETGYTAERIADYGGPERWLHLLEFSADHTDSPMLAAARMGGQALSDGDLITVVGEIKSIPAHTNAALQDWTAALAPYRAIGSPRTAFEGGRAAAQQLRDWVGNIEHPVDPTEWLETLGVQVRTIELSTPLVDAVAVWGPLNGPAILLNAKGLHVRTQRARRATLAHELCHLLLDRSGALPLAEVLGGAAPPGVERRARAFAAELLVPTAAVQRAWADHPDCQGIFGRLQRRFHASAEIVAWQMRNSIEGLTHTDRSYLRAFVSQPQRF
jgi:Zn-dependent peptidase ImmA (M78 family)